MEIERHEIFDTQATLEEISEGVIRIRDLQKAFQSSLILYPKNDSLIKLLKQDEILIAWYELEEACWDDFFYITQDIVEKLIYEFQRWSPLLEEFDVEIDLEAINDLKKHIEYLWESTDRIVPGKEAEETESLIFNNIYESQKKLYSLVLQEAEKWNQIISYFFSNEVYKDCEERDASKLSQIFAIYYDSPEKANLIMSYVQDKVRGVVLDEETIELENENFEILSTAELYFTQKYRITKAGNNKVKAVLA